MDHSHHHHGHHAAEAESFEAAAQRCTMNMLWNTQIQDTCIVFRSWHIYNRTDFVIALVVIAGLGVLYEWLRVVQVKYDRRVAARLATSSSKGKSSTSSSPGATTTYAAISEEDPLLGSSVAASKILSTVPVPQRLARASLYGVAVFLSFFIMLIFMTYNAYLIAAVVVGAAAGHFIFSAEMDTDAVLAASGVGGKGISCH